nr:Chain D, LEDGF peptide [Homo sapiens]3AVJ_F Chain F, LEDGF peptide [Homo sapiens]
ALKIDNMD